MNAELETKSGRPWWMLGVCGESTQRDKENSGRFARWSLVWAISFVAATFLLRRNLVAPGPMAWGVAIAPTLVGLVAMRAFLKYLRELDELQRRVQLEALAMGFGAGILFMMGYRLFERLGAPTLDVSDPLLVMMVVWAFGQVWVARRYQ